MKELVEQLLFLARGDNDSMQIDMRDLDLTQIAAEVLRETEMIDQTHAFAARWDGAVWVHADDGLMKQALRVLVDNAIKYSPSGGRITLSAEILGGRAHLSVQDEGQGIAPESLPHIFDRFYRADAARSGKSHFGLGLSVARELAALHGGTLTVRDAPGGGAAFTLSLPLR